MHRDSGASSHSVECTGAELSGRRAQALDLDLDGESGRGRPDAHTRYILAAGSRLENAARLLCATTRIICSSRITCSTPSHLSYVHEGSLGGTSAIAAARANLERLPRGVRLTRRLSNSVAAPYHVRLGMPEGVPVDRWWIYDYTVPGILLLDSGVQPTAGPAEAGLRFHSCQAVTPENGRSTHYFFTQAHGFALHDAQVTRMLFQSVVAAFEEDRRMIEAQQQLHRLQLPAAKWSGCRWTTRWRSIGKSTSACSVKRHKPCRPIEGRIPAPSLVVVSQARSSFTRRSISSMSL